MCHECGDDHFDDEMDMLNSMPEHEREEFFDFACYQLATVMDKAEQGGFLIQLITEWPKEKQLAFAIATVMENRIQDNLKRIVDEDDQRKVMHGHLNVH